MSIKYFGIFEDRDSVAGQFEVPVETFPAEDDILLATYEYEHYSGSAFVLFERDGKLFEVHGSHCSCYGLEGQWEPEETTWAAIAMRPADDHSRDAAHSRLHELLEQRHVLSHARTDGETK